MTAKEYIVLMRLVDSLKAKDQHEAAAALQKVVEKLALANLRHRGRVT
jgi:hypothetical protein